MSFRYFNKENQYEFLNRYPAWFKKNSIAQLHRTMGGMKSLKVQEMWCPQNKILIHTVTIKTTQIHYTNEI